MTQVVKLHNGITEGIQQLLRHILQEKKARAVLTLRSENTSKAVSYSLVTDPKEFKNVVPFFPVMPNNAGKLLSRMTQEEPFREPVAVILRPCELRAFIELVKRQQGSMVNVVTISPVCHGVFPLKKYSQGEVDRQLHDYWSAISRDEPYSGVRDTCRICEYFVPTCADVIVEMAGEENSESECKLYINTDKGAELIEGIDGEREEAKLETEKITKIRSLRQKEKERLFGETEELISGFDRIVEVFSSCISCHGCCSVCPICYCKLCEFDSRRSDYKPEAYERELGKRGGVRIPPGSVYFQIGRLAHMGISCVGCGMCSDVCPVDIPVSSIFSKVGESAQKMFEYVPGRDVNESIPITTFEEQELSEVED